MPVYLRNRFKNDGDDIHHYQCDDKDIKKTACFVAVFAFFDYFIDTFFDGIVNGQFWFLISIWELLNIINIYASQLSINKIM
jgi:hypothetical protein